MNTPAAEDREFEIRRIALLVYPGLVATAGSISPDAVGDAARVALAAGESWVDALQKRDWDARRKSEASEGEGA